MILVKQGGDPGHIHSEKQPGCSMRETQPSDAEDKFPFLTFGLLILAETCLSISFSTTPGILVSLLGHEFFSALEENT